MRIGIIQQSCSESIAENRKKLAESIAKLAKQGAELVVLQELHDSPYFCQTEDVGNFRYALPIPGEATEFYAKVAKKNHVVLVTSLFEQRAAGLYHNTAVVFEKDGSIAGMHRKMHIPDDPAYYEKFYFTPGDLGFHPIQTSIGKLGVQVCWDQWYPEGARLMALQGADLLVYPTAIGFESTDTKEEQQRQREAWITIQRSHAIASSFVAGQQGELLYQASATKQETAIIDVDLQRTETVRQWWPFLRDRRIDAYEDLKRRFIK